MTKSGQPGPAGAVFSERRRSAAKSRGSNLTLITLKFTLTELQILTGLAADQLFRKEFIDSRVPGFKSNTPELNVGKQLVQRMRLAAGGPFPSVRATGRQTP